jgi:Ca-activated chloride channel family protein
MSKGSSCIPDEDLTRHFQWRWNEHGIYLGVCSTLGLFVFMLYVLPFPQAKNSLAEFEFLRAKFQNTSSVGPASRDELTFLKGGPEEQSGRAPHHEGGAVHRLRSPREAVRHSGLLGTLKAAEGSHTASLFARDLASGNSVLGGLIGNNIGDATGVGGFGSIGTGTRAAGQLHRGEQSIGYGRPAPASGPAIHTLAVSPVAHTITIDPNGRFATTYRPGHGHLDWFDAELGRNQVPPQIRQLVGDLGSRYAPALPAPEGRALIQQVDVERTALPPGGGPVAMRIALRSSKDHVDAQRLRPPLAVHVVLDVSGSMSGTPLAEAKQAVHQLLGRLLPTDRFSLTAFESNAYVVVPDATVGSRQQLIRQQVDAVRVAGSTNMAAGLDLGYGEALRHRLGPEWVSLVMVLSDGHPNVGESWPEALSARAAEAFQAGIQTSAFGVSDKHDGLLMSQIAERGAGGYYYLPNVEAIPSALAAELDTRLQPVAQAVEVRVRLAPEVQLTATHGSRKLDARESAQVTDQERAVDAQAAQRDQIARDRMREIEGGMRFFIPGFARDDRHVILLGLRVPAGMGKRALATVELRYKDRLRHDNVEDRQSIQIPYASSDVASVATLNPSVAATIQGFAAGETLVTASGLIGSIDSARASALLAERAALLRKAASTLHEPRLASDATRIDQLRQVIARNEVPDPLLLAQLLNHSGQGLLH